MLQLRLVGALFLLPITFLRVFAKNMGLLQQEPVLRFLGHLARASRIRISLSTLQAPCVTFAREKDVQQQLFILLLVHSSCLACFQNLSLSSR